MYNKAKLRPSKAQLSQPQAFQAGFAHECCSVEGRGCKEDDIDSIGFISALVMGAFIMLSSNI